MKHAAARAALACAIALSSLQLGASTVPQEVRAALPAAGLAGQAKLSAWGFDIYSASLWVQPGFSAAGYAQHAFALELRYLRDLSGEAIAKRSVAEMRRQGSINPALQTRWEQQMRALFPDVHQGDRLTGIHRPELGAVFLLNGQLLGEIRDADFARLFFGIWLSTQTSEPGLRQSLLERIPRGAATP